MPASSDHSGSPRESMEEEEPLLSPIDASAAHSLSSLPKNKPWILLVVLAFAMVSIVDVGAFLSEAPKTRVFEANLCLSYYQEHDPSMITHDGTVPEDLCKGDAIQQKLAMIFGWQDTFDAIPGILLAVPLGALADRIGRKWIFVVSLMGLQLNSAFVLLICKSTGPWL